MAPSLRRGVVLALAASSVSATPMPAAEEESVGWPGIVLDNPHPDKATGAEQHCSSTELLIPHINLGPTFTSYTTTTTTTRLVDCGACAKYTVSFLPLGVPPVARFTTTKTAREASTTSVLRCGGHAPTPRPGRRDPPPPAEETDDPGRGYETGGAAPTARTEHFWSPPRDALSPSLATLPGQPEPSCTHSTHMALPIPDGTLTVYPSTVTSSHAVDCGSCALQWTTAVPQFFAPVRLTATTSPATPSTKTDFVCRPTAEPESDGY